MALTKEEKEKFEALETKVSELTGENTSLKEEVASLKKHAPKGAKKTKKIQGLKASVLHSGKMFLQGTKKEDLPEDLLKAHKSKIGEVEIEVED